MNPSPLASFVTDKRLWLLLLTGALAVVLGFFALSGAPAIAFVSVAGYWFQLAAFGLWVRALWLTFRADLGALRWRSIDWASVTIVAAGGVVLLVHEPSGFKIVMDEIMLLGTSMSMHFDRTVLTPLRGNDIQGAFVILDGMMDKRPLFFPFLLSLLHDLTGYRPANAFLLNGALTFAFLGLVCAAGRMLAGRVAGWIGVTLFAGLPLLGQNATGGGFELLNLVMILATLLLGARFLDRRDEASLTALVFSGLLLAQVRYESALYLLPVALIVGWGWFTARQLVLSWPVVLAPLLLIIYPLQHRIFELRTSAWQLESKPEASAPFSLGYVGENLAHAAGFFFASPKDQPSSLLLSLLGWLALPFALLLLAKRIRTLNTESPAVVATLVFTVGFVGQFLLLMGYFWGKFDDPVIRRLSLPTHLWLVLAVFLVLPEFASAAVQRCLLGLAAFSVFGLGVPAMAAHAYTQEYWPGREIEWCRRFIAEQPARDYLVIDSNSVLWVTHQVSATSPAEALRRRDALMFHLRNRTFSAIYVFQHFGIDPATGRMTPREGDDLGPDFVLEPVREERLHPLCLSRLSRLTEIRSGATVVHEREAKDVEVTRSRAETEQLRRAYLEQFMKQLP